MCRARWKWLVIILGLVGLMPVGLTESVTSGSATALADTSPVVGCDDSTQGLIVYDQSLWSEGEDAAIVGGQLVVVKPDGAELHRIDLPAGAFAPTPLGIGCLELVAGSLDAPDAAWLVDPGAGTLRPIALPAGVSGGGLSSFPNAQPTFQGRRYAVLKSQQLGHLLLLDSRTATTTDIGAVIRDLRGDVLNPLDMSEVQLCSDESRLIVIALDRRELWLLPTEEPYSGRAIYPTRSGAFSEDGQHILYLQSAGTAGVPASLVIESVDGTGKDIVETAEIPLQGWWVPGTGGTQVLVRRETSMSLLDLTTRQERELASLEESIQLWGFAPSGQRALLYGELDSEHRRWIWADLTTGVLRELDPLADYPLPSPRRNFTAFGPSGGFRWITFPPVQGIYSEGKSGDIVFGLDIETGTVRQLLLFERDYSGVDSSLASATGRFSTVCDFGTGAGCWLLEATTGAAQWFPGRQFWGFSLDENWLVATDREDSEHARRYRVLIASTEGDVERVLGRDVTLADLAWLPLAPLPES